LDGFKERVDNVRGLKEIQDYTPPKGTIKKSVDSPSANQLKIKK
jgi:hypothetical protein